MVIFVSENHQKWISHVQIEQVFFEESFQFWRRGKLTGFLPRIVDISGEIELNSMTGGRRNDPFTFGMRRRRRRIIWWGDHDIFDVIRQRQTAAASHTYFLERQLEALTKEADLN